jgi:hypothetical protein
LSQRPTGSLGLPFAQCTLLSAPPVGVPGAPQQSLSVWQSSPVGRQPLGGSQMKTWVWPYGAHDRLQQFPPHAGNPPSPTPPSATPPQTSPAIVHIVPPGDAGTEHVPSVMPLAIVQMPPQHSLFVLQTSPVCVQNDGRLEHAPFSQNDEQHSALVEHVLPDVLHVGFNGVHVPAPPSAAAPQTPPQQLTFVVHAWLSLMQSVELHVPPLQTKVQHSFDVAHAVPAVLHWPIGFAQCFVESHSAEQQSPLAAQLAPRIPQCAPSPLPPSPTVPSPRPLSSAPPSSPGCAVSSPPQPLANKAMVTAPIKVATPAYANGDRLIACLVKNRVSSEFAPRSYGPQNFLLFAPPPVERHVKVGFAKRWQ